MGHFTPEVFGTPIDCQAIFLSPLAASRVQWDILRTLFPYSYIDAT
ncbi:hypothetical protein CEV33_4731 [Brucella grignonensis]|uniref:Uncharacterized protein n=1 Tax=Brucella grignonensis TaxID=94627 RepID=A0A256G4G9_9HYPH|nr:hypothetical protein CEV33_4731 [Brucella grignonensis]